jgi:hypothetical protein
VLVTNRNVQLYCRFVLYGCTAECCRVCASCTSHLYCRQISKLRCHGGSSGACCKPCYLQGCQARTALMVPMVLRDALELTASRGPVGPRGELTSCMWDYRQHCTGTVPAHGAVRCDTLRMLHVHHAPCSTHWFRGSNMKNNRHEWCPWSLWPWLCPWQSGPC